MAKEENKGRKDKQKKIIRVVAGIMAALIATSIIVAPIYAEDKPPLTSTISEESLVDEQGKPTKAIPKEFEYKDDGGLWVVRRAKGNTLPSFHIDTHEYEECDAQNMMIYVGNLVTKEVTPISLPQGQSYLATKDLKDGYYVIFNNKLAWENSKGKAYTINDQDTYFYVGNEKDFKQEYFGVEFTRANKDIIKLSLNPSPEGSTLVKYGEEPKGRTPNIPSDRLLTPNEEYAPPKTPNNDNQVENNNNTQEQTIKVEDKSFFDYIVSILKNSFLVIIGIVACFVGLHFIKLKKIEKQEKQAEEDMLDDQRID